MKVVVYSHDADTRARVRLAIGRRPAPDVPDAEIIEVATEPALFRLLDAGGADVMVLDGEAQPAGGMGICRQAKDEIHDCPPVLLIVGRVDDGWLATWSGAEAVTSHPIDPVALAEGLAGLMRQRAEHLAAQADGPRPAARIRPFTAPTIPGRSPASARWSGRQLVPHPAALAPAAMSVIQPRGGRHGFPYRLARRDQRADPA